MLKSELINLLNELEDNANVDDVVKEHYKSNVNDFKLDDLLNHPELKGYIRSEQDRAVTKGIETFKNNKLQQLVQEELKKKETENLSPEMIQIKELQQQLESIQKEKAIIESRNKYTKMLNEKNLPVELVDFINDDEHVDKFVNILTNYANTEVNNRISNTYKPPMNNEPIKSQPTLDNVQTVKDAEALWSNVWK